MFQSLSGQHRIASITTTSSFARHTYFLFSAILTFLLINIMLSHIQAYTTRSFAVYSKVGATSWTRTLTQMAMPKAPALRDGVGFAKGSLNKQGRYRLELEQLSGLPPKKPYLVLGVESSCDDTGVAVVSSAGQILSNVVISQHSIHESFGGVVPSLAMEAHRKNIEIAIVKAIEEAGLKSVADVDAIAVTRGPGLEICLRIGYQKALALAQEFNKPFVNTHHLEAHCLIARLAGQEITREMTQITPPSSSSSPQPGNPDTAAEASVEFTPKIQFPFLVFLASGGHTSILLCKGIGEFDFLGGTLDDALGEAFDKAARLLGLGVIDGKTGGAAVEILARKYQQQYLPTYVSKSERPRHTMKVPMRERPGFDFSYAGLKSSFRLEVQKTRAALGLDIDSSNAPSNQMETISSTVTLPEEQTSFLCHAFQEVAFTHVEDRLKRTLQYLQDKDLHVNGLVVVGGVAANLELRRRLLDLLELNQGDNAPMKLIFPPVKLCTDNGVMSAWAGIEKFNLGVSNVKENQDVLAKWPLGTPVVDPLKTTYTSNHSPSSQGKQTRKANTNSTAV